MTVGMLMEFPGATLEQYDEVIIKMGFNKGGPGAGRSVLLGQPQRKRMRSPTSGKTA
jgi:hypothetical protein